MTLSELRSIHSALVTLQRPAYHVSPAVRLQAARAASLMEPQIRALDEAIVKLRNEASLAAAAADQAFQAQIQRLREECEASVAALVSAPAAAVEIPKLPAAEFAKPDTPAELLEVIKPLFDHLSDP